MRAIRKLSSGETWRYRDHLLRLPADDRRMRFGHPVDDAVIARFVADLPSDRTRIFVIEDAAGRVIAAVLIAVYGDGAELAFSVDPAHRRQGHARALFRRALLWVRNRGIGTIELACLAENRAIRKLARDMQMTAVVAGGDAEASLAVPPPSPFSVWREVAWDAAAARRRARTAWRRLLPLARLEAAA